jgi:hypothetical protein
MGIYRPTPKAGFSWVHPITDADDEQLSRVSGEPLTDWEVPRVKLMASNDRDPETDRLADMPWLGQHCLVFRDGVLDRASPILGSWGQFLELRVDDDPERMWVFNNRSVVDALDE